MSLFLNISMRKHPRIALALLLLTMIGGIAWLALHPDDPTYKGKRLSVWLEGYNVVNRPSEPIRAQEAYEAVRHIGTNAIPTLLRRLRAKDSKLTLQLVALTKKQHFYKFKFKAAKDLNREGYYGFMTLGSDGKDAVPELIRMYEQDHSTESRYLVVSALGFIGPTAEQAVPMLVQSLGDTNWEARCQVIGVLGQIHARPELTVPALVKCLSDQNIGARRLAADAIGAFGSAAEPALPDLRKMMLAGATIYEKDAARKSINKIDPEALKKAGVNDPPR
jgi:HEAT repeats